MTTEYPQMEVDTDFAETLQGAMQAAKRRRGEAPGQEQTSISAATKSGNGSK